MSWSKKTQDSSRRIFPQPSAIAYREKKNLKGSLVRSKVFTKRKSNRKQNGYLRCGKGFFGMFVTHIGLACFKRWQTKFWVMVKYLKFWRLEFSRDWLRYVTQMQVKMLEC